MIEYENLRDVNEPFFSNYTHNFNNVLNTGIFVHGNYVTKFEETFAKYIDSRFCVACASRTDALLLSVKSLNFEEDSEIILASNSHVSNILAVVYSGCVPVLVEPDLNNYNINPGRIEEKITSKTKAILAVHLYGKPCNMDEISEIAFRKNLKIIEECSHSHGAKYKDRRTGAFGATASFGFDPTKILGALGDAGAVVTNDKYLADKLISLRNCGENDESEFDMYDFNSCPNELQYGFLLSKFKKLDEMIEHKRKLANLYNMFLKDDFIKPVVDKDSFDVYFEYNIRHPQRDKLRAFLHENEIQTKIPYFSASYKNKNLQDLIHNEKFPIADEIQRTMLSLPISFAHQEMEIFKVIETMNRF